MTDESTTQDLLVARLATVEEDIASMTNTRQTHIDAAKKITDALPAKRLEANRLKRALGIPCREKKTGGESAAEEANQDE